MALTEVIKIKERGQIVIPRAIRKHAHCESGDLVEATVKNNVIILRPVKTHPREQEWFWSKHWQKMEREAQSDIDAGRVKKFDSAQALIKDLNK